MTTNDQTTLSDMDLALPSLPDLRKLFNGKVIAPDDPRYEQARKVFYGRYDRRPAAILHAADPGRCRAAGVAGARKWL